MIAFSKRLATVYRDHIRAEEEIEAVEGQVSRVLSGKGVSNADAFNIARYLARKSLENWPSNVVKRAVEWLRDDEGARRGLWEQDHPDVDNPTRLGKRLEKSRNEVVRVLMRLGPPGELKKKVRADLGRDLAPVRAEASRLSRAKENERPALGCATCSSQAPRGSAREPCGRLHRG
ncbi:MAG: hypothetical protein QM765_39010 [Myxococcales bacterium]